MIEFYATQPHYREHLQPIADELGGRFIAHPGPLPTDELLVVAGAMDLRHGRRPAVFVEHGAGQTYLGSTMANYPGGSNRESVRLFICPSERVANLNRARYPNAEYAVVGCPRLDRWHSGERIPRKETVAVAFHWPVSIPPEAGSAWEHYAAALGRLRAVFGRVIGHAHPRIFKALSGAYRAVGIEPVQDVDEVFERASVLAVDNSSVGWEAMSVGIPVVWLNAPWYRRHVEHGLRFWALADSGVQVDEPSDLVGGIALALADPQQVRERREAAVEEVYAFRDGKAARRAADAIEALRKVNDVIV